MSSIVIFDNQKSVYTMKVRWGENMNAGITVGYELWDHLLLGLNARVAVIATHAESIERPELQSMENFYIGGFFGVYEYSSPVLQFAPQIGYKVQSEKFSAYFSLGPNFMSTKIRLTSNQSTYGFVEWVIHPLEKVTKYEYGGGLHMGIQADLGLCYSLRPNLQLVMDFVMAYNNYKVTKGEITWYEINGEDQMDTLNETEIGIDPDNNKLNHSHLGVNVGLRFFFGMSDQKESPLMNPN